VTDKAQETPNPAEKYGSPDEVLRQSNLTKEQKLKILKDWEDEQKALLRADDENMPAQAETTVQKMPETIIKSIQKAERQIEGVKQPPSGPDSRKTRS
jgi:hypothetical protein